MDMSIRRVLTGPCMWSLLHQIRLLPTQHIGINLVSQLHRSLAIVSHVRQYLDRSVLVPGGQKAVKCVVPRRDGELRCGSEVTHDIHWFSDYNDTFLIHPSYLYGVLEKV